MFIQKVGPRILDREGKEAPGVWGYKYFGAARDLPGVRELFEKPGTLSLLRLPLCLHFIKSWPPIDHRLDICVPLVSEAPPPKKTRGELAREADPFYYGFRDDEDQTLVPIEREAEQKGAIRL